MYCRPAMTVLAALLAAGLLTSAVESADGGYTYKPYGQQNQAGSDAANSPANALGRAAPERYELKPKDAGGVAAAPAPRGDAWRAPDSGSVYEPDRGGGERIDSRPPPATQQGFAAAGLIEATASAPDRSVPYTVREQDARNAAIEAWRSKARERFGPEFSQWRLADRRHVDCVRDRGDDAVCTVSGVPMRGDDRHDGRYPDDRD